MSIQLPAFFKEVKMVKFDQVGTVVQVMDPASFYVQLWHSLTKIEEMDAQTNMRYADGLSKPSIHGPKLGSPCVVQCVMDKRWYRGKIVKICGRQSLANVLLVDVGRLEEIPVGKVKSIDSYLLQQPPLSIHCKLARVDESRNWTADEKVHFENSTLGKVFSLTFGNQEYDGKYSVVLLGLKEERYVLEEYFERFPSPPFVGYPSATSDNDIGVNSVQLSVINTGHVKRRDATLDETRRYIFIPAGSEHTFLNRRRV